jgi:hypothetical protein
VKGLNECSSCIKVITATSRYFDTKKSPPPTKDPPFCLDGKRKEHTLLKFPAVRSSNCPTKRCKVCFKKEKIVKLGGIVESVVFSHILGNAILYYTHTASYNLRKV